MAKNISVVLMTFAMFFITLKAEKKWTIGISVTKEEMMSNFKVNSLRQRRKDYIDDVKGIIHSFRDKNVVYLKDLKELKDHQNFFVEQAAVKLHEIIDPYWNNVYDQYITLMNNMLEATHKVIRKESMVKRATLKVIYEDNKLSESNDVQCDITYGEHRVNRTIKNGGKEILVKFLNENYNKDSTKFMGYPDFKELIDLLEKNKIEDIQKNNKNKKELKYLLEKNGGLEITDNIEIPTETNENIKKLLGDKTMFLKLISKHCTINITDYGIRVELGPNYGSEIDDDLLI